MAVRASENIWSKFTAWILSSSFWSMKTLVLSKTSQISTDLENASTARLWKWQYVVGRPQGILYSSSGDQAWFLKPAASRALILYVGAGALTEALATLRNAQLPETAALFLLACHEAKAIALAFRSQPAREQVAKCPWRGGCKLDLPGALNTETGVATVCEYFGQYQRLLAHTVTGLQPVND